MPAKESAASTTSPLNNPHSPVASAAGEFSVFRNALNLPEKNFEKILKNFQKDIDKRNPLWYNNHVLKRAGKNQQKEALEIVQFAGVAQWQSS